jgi:hypothetical protein
MGLRPNDQRLTIPFPKLPLTPHQLKEMKNAIAQVCNELSDHRRHGHSGARGRVLGKPKAGE